MVLGFRFRVEGPTGLGSRLEGLRVGFQGLGFGVQGLQDVAVESPIGLLRCSHTSRAFQAQSPG